MVAVPRADPQMFEEVKDPGNHEAWQLFCDLYQPLIQKWLRRLAPQQADVEDLTQNVLLKLLLELRSFDYDPSRSFSGWLWMVTYREFCAWWRSRPRDRATGSSDSLAQLDSIPERNQDSAVEREYQNQCLEWAVARVRHEFDERTYQSFSLHMLEGRKLQDVATTLGASLAWVFRAKEKVLARVRAELQAVASNDFSAGR